MKALKARFNEIDLLLVIVPLLSILILSFLFFRHPFVSKNILGAWRVFLTTKFSWFYLIIGLIFLISTIFLVCSKYGKIKIGVSSDKPVYSPLKWGMMIFTSTMSADIIFYSLCEWMMYFRTSTSEKNGNALEQSLTYSLFHWGPIAWSFYIMLAVAFAYMLYVRKNKRQKFSEACRPLLGKFIDGWLGKLIDLIAIFSLVAATATTFSMSMPLLSTAIKTLTGVGNIKWWSVILMVLVVTIYLTASVIGMKAISRLSIIAFSVFGLFLLYILVMGNRFGQILNLGGHALVNLVGDFVPMSVGNYGGSSLRNSTVFYWAYWIVWCVATPFFIGSISKGKTIRSIVLGGYFWGLLGTYMSFIILSGFGISQQIRGLINVTNFVSRGSNYANAAVILLKTLPHFQIALILLILSMIGLYSTVFDSITMVISKYSYKSLSLEDNPSKGMRAFWALAFIILPLVLLWNSESVYDIQSVAIIAALPVGIVMLLIIVSFYVEIFKKNIR